MYELKHDPFYELIERCPGCVVEFRLMKDDAPERGVESHREALACAMRSVSLPDGEEEPTWEYDAEKASAKRISAKDFLSLPEKPWKKTARWKDGTAVTLYTAPTDGGDIPYWRAFLEPPHGSGCTEEDFQRVNDVLFPNGTDGLTVYEWSTDWSDYFDDGHEWWGAGCWSVYDSGADRYVVILASATD